MYTQKLSRFFTFTKILFIALYTNLKHILLILLFVSMGCQLSFSQDIPKKDSIQIPQKKDTLNLSKDKFIPKSIDTVKIDSVKAPKGFLQDIIRKSATDSISNDFANKRTTLYNEAELYYQDIELKAGIIIIDYEKNLAYAKGIVDTSGVYEQRPIFKQSGQDSEQDSLIYNFKNEKALIYNTKTEQSGIIIRGEITKRENDSTLYVNKAIFTTSEKERPDYHISTNNI